MLRQGPIPRAVHGLIEYAAGALFIAAPFLLSFEARAATAVAVVVGVLLVFVAATSAGATSLVDQIPVAAHVVLDYILAAFLIAAPFLFGFSDETAPTAFFIAAGVVHLLITVGTRFLPERAAPAAAAEREPAGPGGVR